MRLTGDSSQENLMKKLASDLGNTRSARVLIPICQIYLEHQIVSILEKKLDPEELRKIKKDRNFDFWQKLDKLRTINLLSKEEFHDLNLLNEIRNDFVYDFSSNLEKISEKFSKMEFYEFDEKRKPNEVILYEIFQLMTLLDKKKYQTIEPFQDNTQSNHQKHRSHNNLKYCKEQFWLL